MSDLAGKVIEACRTHGLTLATAESCTGGMVAAALTDIAGSSAVLDRGFITYSNNAKMQMLGVSDATLTMHGAVSEEVAQEMADGALNTAQTDLSVAITGIAGPGPSEHKPEGRVCFAMAQSGAKTTVVTVEFGAIGRANVRSQSAQYALNMILTAAKSGR